MEPFSRGAILPRHTARKLVVGGTLEGPAVEHLICGMTAVGSQGGVKTYLRVGTLNVGTLRGRAGEVVEVLSRRWVDVCCMQETRWSGESARFDSGEYGVYKLFWKVIALGLVEWAYL